MKNGNDKEIISINYDLLSEKLNTHDMILLKRLYYSPHRFNAELPESVAIALIISRLFCLDLIWVDVDDTNRDIIVSLSQNGRDVVSLNFKEIGYCSH